MGKGSGFPSQLWYLYHHPFFSPYLHSKIAKHVELLPHHRHYTGNYPLRHTLEEITQMSKTKAFFTGLKQGMKEFGENINLIVNSVLLLFVYIIGVGITSLIAKIVGKHFLERKLSKEAKTYWSDLNIKRKPLKEYYRQF